MDGSEKCHEGIRVTLGFMDERTGTSPGLTRPRRREPTPREATPLGHLVGSGSADRAP